MMCSCNQGTKMEKYMSSIKMIPEEEATGKVKEIYAEIPIEM